MKYIYQGKSILEYLKDQGIKTNQERMKMATDILLFHLNNPILTYEEAVDEFLNHYHSSNKNETTSKRNKMALYYREVPLIQYLKNNCEQDLPTKDDQIECMRSIKHYLKTNQDNIPLDYKIDQYFELYYEKFLHKRKSYQLSYRGYPVTDILKEYYPQYTSYQISRCKSKIIQYLDRIKENTMDYSDDELIEYAVNYYFHIDLSSYKPIRKR